MLNDPQNQIPSSSNPNMSSSAQNTSSSQLPYTQMPTYYPNYNPYVNPDQQVVFQQWQLKQQFLHTKISQQRHQAASSQQQSQQHQQPQEEEADMTPTSTKSKGIRFKKMTKVASEKKSKEPILATYGPKKRSYFWRNVIYKYPRIQTSDQNKN
ncbi:hypothetical protein Tco_1095905 [Tanacetum coccineum]